MQRELEKMRVEAQAMTKEIEKNRSKRKLWKMKPN
jgi:hypothetical protein